MMIEDMTLEDDIRPEEDASCSRKPLLERLAEIRSRAQQTSGDTDASVVTPDQIKEAIDDLQRQYCCSTISKGEKLRSMRDAFIDVRRIISIRADELIRRVMDEELELLNKLEAMNFELEEIEQTTTSFHSRLATNILELSNLFSDLGQDYLEAPTNESELRSLHEDVIKARDELAVFKTEFENRTERCRFEFIAKDFAKNETLVGSIPAPSEPETPPEPRVEGQVEQAAEGAEQVDQPDQDDRGENFRPINAICDFLDNALHVQVDHQKREDMERGFRHWYLSVDNGFWNTASVFGIPRP